MKISPAATFYFCKQNPTVSSTFPCRLLASPYRVLTADNVLVPASVTVLAVHSPGLVEFSPGSHRVDTGRLPLGTPPYRLLNVCAASRPSHTVYKRRALTRSITNFVPHKNSSNKYLTKRKYLYYINRQIFVIYSTERETARETN